MSRSATDGNDNPSLTPGQRELEMALRDLSPSASRIDRDRLMFDAGAAVVGARTRRFAGTIGGMLVVALALALFWRPSAQVVERIVFVPGPAVQDDDDGVRVAGGTRDAAATTAPVQVASLTSVMVPFPGGPFVTVPRDLVGRMGVKSGAMPTAAYLERIQDVFQHGWKSVPPADEAGNGGAIDDPPAEDSHRS